MVQVRKVEKGESLRSPLSFTNEAIGTGNPFIGGDKTQVPHG